MRERAARIINTKNNMSTHKLQVRDYKLKYIILLVLLIGLFGCAQQNDQPQAVDYALQSEEYYQRAIQQYQGLIKTAKNTEAAYFNLGKLYYGHGDYQQAIESFKKTSLSGVDKFAAISYYRLGYFTDALEVFNKNGACDAESLYYYGLTCERLNLFDRALGIYAQIKDVQFKDKAVVRINEIEKQSARKHIKAIDPQIHKILLGSPSAQMYPQAGALILLCDESIEITADKKEITSLHYLIKVLNERGKEDFSEVQIDYDSTYEKVELEYARTIKPDGEVADVGSRHMRDVTKYLNYPLYSNARVFIISFPEIAEGAIIEYKVKIYRSQMVNKKDFTLYYPLQAPEPLIAAQFKISSPKDIAVNMQMLNERYNNFFASLKPLVKEDGQRTVYSWQFKDIPQIMPEPSMPPLSEINPSIVVSTFKSWQEVYNWWWAQANDKIIADKPIKDKVKELSGKLPSQEDKARAIYNFCAQNIRYVAVEYGDAGYEPHAAVDIFRNKYGDCKDQAILLVTMLKEAGLTAWPVLIPTKDNYNLNDDFPSLPFDHCITAVFLENRIIFLDPTVETCSFGDLPSGDQDRRVLVFKEDGYTIEETPLYPSRHNLNKQDLKIKIGNDETIKAEKNIFTYGVYDQAQRFWLLYTPPELIGQTLKEKIQEVSIGAQLIDYNIKNLKDLNQPLVFNYSFSGPEYFTDAGPLRIMPQLAGVDVSLVAKDKRVYPIDLGIPDLKEIDLEIEIPRTFVIKYMPQNVVEDSPWIKFTAEYSYVDNRIIFRQYVEAKKSKISEEEYPEFKIFFESLAKKLKQRIVLEKAL